MNISLLIARSIAFTVTASALMLGEGAIANLEMKEKIGVSRNLLAQAGCKDIHIQPGFIASRGMSWTTCTGYKLIFQNDGNLVLYNQEGNAIWATGTDDTNANRLEFQSDGNLVLYADNTPLWASSTDGNSGASLAIQNDGNIVIYSLSNQKIFDINTGSGRFRTTYDAAQWRAKRSGVSSQWGLNNNTCKNIELQAGNFYRRGASWMTCTKFRLVFQEDGNLVLYNPIGNAIWATGTHNTGADQFSIQNDGNIVLSARGRNLWTSGTENNSGSFFSIQNNGNLVVYDQQRKSIFSTNTDGGQFQATGAATEWRFFGGKIPQIAKNPNIQPVEPKEPIESKIPPDYAGNSPSFSVARKIPNGVGTALFDDWVGIVDRDDYYSLTLNKKSSVTFEANDAIALSVLDLNGVPANIISERTGASYTKENIGNKVQVVLNPGTYYLKISEILPKFDDPRQPLNGVFYTLKSTIEDVKITKYPDARRFTIAQVLNSQVPEETQMQLDTIDAISKKQYSVSSKIPDTELLRKSLSDIPINEGESLGSRKSFSYRDYLSLRMNLVEQSKAINYAKDIIEKNMEYLSYLEESSDSEARKIQADTSSSFVEIYSFTNLSRTSDIKRSFIVALEETRVSTQKLIVGSLEAGLEASQAWTPLGDVLDLIKGYDNIQLLSDFGEIKKYLEEITPIIEEMRGYSKKGDLFNTELKLIELAHRTIKWTDDLKVLGKEAKYLKLAGNLVFLSRNILDIHALKKDDDFKGVLTSFDITYLTSAQISSGLEIFDSFLDVLPDKVVGQKISSSFDVLMKAFAFNYEQSTSRQYRSLLKQEYENQKILKMYSHALNMYIVKSGDYLIKNRSDVIYQNQNGSIDVISNSRVFPRAL